MNLLKLIIFNDFNYVRQIIFKTKIIQQKVIKRMYSNHGLYNFKVIQGLRKIFCVTQHLHFFNLNIPTLLTTTSYIFHKILFAAWKID